MPQFIALVVEDEPDIQQLMVRHLERLGLAVETAATGEAALARLSVSTPDIVLLDLHLPGIQGQDVADRLRACSETAITPIVVVSIADTDSIDVGPVDGWLVKPFSGRAVAREVRRLLPSLAAAG